MISQPGKWWRRSKGSGRPRHVREIDWSLLLPVLVLTGIGVAMIFSATQGNSGMAHLYLRQAAWAVLGLLVMLAAATGNYQVLLNRYAYPAYWLLVVLLAVLLAAGPEISGSRRWLSLGPFGIQPSEFAKVATTLVLAKFLAAREDRLQSWETFFGALALVGLPTLLILNEPDLGTAMVFVALFFVLLYAAGVAWQRLALVVGAGLLASPLVWLVLKDYQRQRLMVFLNPSADSLGAGYNVIQSKIAIGSGQWFGKGWLQGTQGQLRFVPEHHTDFIFSVLAEEWGFIGAVLVLAVFVVLLLQALRVARQARDLAGSLVTIGLTGILAVQVTVNLGVALGVMPATGMTLPFLSYGGSSLMTSMLMVGIIMNIRANRIVK